MMKETYFLPLVLCFTFAVTAVGVPGVAEPQSAGDRRLFSDIFAVAASASGSRQAVPFFPSASDALGRQGFARVISHSSEAGEVSIVAFDDEGRSYGPLTLSLGANETALFNSDDLENGNLAKGLTGRTGAGQGDWRLELTSALHIEALSYIHTSDGFLASMHDTVPWRNGEYWVAIFNPGINRNQESLLRLVNPGEAAATVTITATDDAGASGTGAVTVEVPAGAARTFSAAELESGSATELVGSLGDGSGKWRLAVRSDRAITAMSLLSSPTGYLTNLSTVPGNEFEGVHHVALFLSASDPFGRQGFVRVINDSELTGEVSIKAFDETGREYEAVSLSLGANETKHFNSNDLEMGNTRKGLSGSTGGGIGDWRLELTSDLELEVLAYVRTTDGFLTSMHETVSREGNAYRVATLNPGANFDHESRLRLVNAGAHTAEMTITGINYRGERSSRQVSIAVPARASRTLTAQELEGADGAFEQTFGNGAGKWRLVVESERPIAVLNLLSSPTGHLANLSSDPTDALTFTFDFHRGVQGFVADFADYPPANKEIFELTSDYRPLPSPLESKSALFISGVNRSDDLFMFYKGHIGGLVPGARYDVTVSVEIATATPTGCYGVGGAPGESVWIKAGATEVEPLPVPEHGYLQMNVDIGNQSQGGEHAVVLGNVANSRSCEQSRQWELKSFPGRSTPVPVSASSSGRVWLLFGADSGFEDRTEVYFTRASVTFTPMGSTRPWPIPYPDRYPPCDPPKACSYIAPAPY